MSEEKEVTKAEVRSGWARPPVNVPYLCFNLRRVLTPATRASFCDRMTNPVGQSRAKLDEVIVIGRWPKAILLRAWRSGRGNRDHRFDYILTAIEQTNSRNQESIPLSVCLPGWMGLLSPRISGLEPGDLASSLVQM